MAVLNPALLEFFPAPGFSYPQLSLALVPPQLTPTGAPMSL